MSKMSINTSLTMRLDKHEPKDVIEFIKRRFSADAGWLNGNCFYFALILRERFPHGLIYYDTVDGHFLFSMWQKKKKFYFDQSGIVKPNEDNLVLWNNFERYDPERYKAIIRDCIL